MNIKIIIPILNPSKDFFINNLKILKNQTVKVDIILINSGDKIPEDLSYKVIDINKIDGLRLTLDNETIIHLRPSGNAPELRCYVETSSQNDSDSLVNQVLSCIREMTL